MRRRLMLLAASAVAALCLGSEAHGGGGTYVFDGAVVRPALPREAF